MPKLKPSAADQETPSPAPAPPPSADHATTVSIRILPLGDGKVARGGEGIADFHVKGAIVCGVPLNVARAQEANGYVEIQDAGR
jgi:hypothetical protein